ARLDAPPVVSPGEGFLITAWVSSPTPQRVRYELKRGNEVISVGERDLVSGLNRLTFRDKAIEAGNQDYSLHVAGSGIDPTPENNLAKLLVGIQGPRPILCVSNTD